MTIKKVFIELHSFLEANADRKIKSILEEATILMSAKTAGGTGASNVHKNEAGEVTHVFDYYFKTWMPVATVEFGAKASSASGLNTMCKEGVANWTKQQREFKKAKEALLEMVGSGEVQPSEIESRLAGLEVERNAILPHSAGAGFSTLEEALAAAV